MLQSRVLKLINIVSSLLLFWTLFGMSYAQTTLLPGDLVVVTTNISTNELELIPLIDIEEGTMIELKGSGVDGGFESNVITFIADVNKGQRLVVSNAESDVITKSKTLDIASEKGVITFSQPDEGINRLLLGLSWGNYQTSVPFPLAKDSFLPFLRFGDGMNFQYHLKNGASGTTTMLVNMIVNPANWRTSDKAFGSFQTSLRILSGPVIVFDQNVSTVAESDSIRLNVAIYEHDGSKLTVDAKFHQGFSTADTNDVNRFKTYTFNFTGLIGDAVYEKVIPLNDDNIYEGRETAFFELGNLTAGQFGDFISHAAFIRDNEIPDVNIAIAEHTESTLPAFTFINNERVYVDVSGWLLKFGDQEVELTDVLEIAPFEQRTIILEEFIKKEEVEYFERLRDKKVSVLTDEGILIKELTFELPKTIVQLNPKEKVKRQIDVDLSNAKTDRSTTTDVGSPNIPKIATVNDSVQVIEKGWKPFKDNIASAELQLLFWDERQQLFREITDSNQDSVNNIGAIYFYDSELMHDAQLELFEDTTVQAGNLLSQSDWMITVSATDKNEDEVVNGAEGWNLIQNKSGLNISVSSLIAALDDHLGAGAINPYIFDWQLSQNSLKKGSDVITADALFWIKADSLFDRTEVVISTEQLSQTTPEVIIEDEPVSMLSLLLYNDATSQHSEIYLFDSESELKKSVPNPAIDLPENSIIPQNLKFGLQSESQWFSRLNLSYSTDALYAIPIGLRDSVSNKMTLEVSEWNLEGGWQVFIEDIETEEIAELLPGVGFSFEYVASNNDVDTESESNEDGINQRYRLLLVPPGVELLDEAIPEQIELFQNYPNPFNPATTISFYLPEPVEVSLSIFNVVGQPVVTLTKGVLNAGEHHFEWNATGYPSGMYIYQLEVGTKVLTRKMTLVK
ncbi:MAG: T9SS type A sorting domain-containing protein [Balneolaceae bacterium]|nr:T9SS type A sorting domain-containing protein [Balneolaceae bacterium]